MTGPILITGATGQVGSALLKLFPDALAPSRAELDLADEASIRTYIQANEPAWILNPAAYTAVDKAESEPELAYAINAEAPRILGEEAARYGAPVIHFSTDYVFDGTLHRPYTELDSANPTSVYGSTKLAGEQALAATEAPHIILRTSWVYGPTGKNFLLTILRLARERAATGQPLNIVADQYGAPTCSSALANLTREIVLQVERAAAIAESLPADVIEECSGVYHATCAGEATWYGFAIEIVRQARLLDPTTPLVDPQPISTSAYPTPARRPANSRLNCTKLAETFELALPSWQDFLAIVLPEALSPRP